MPNSQRRETLESTHQFVYEIHNADEPQPQVQIYQLHKLMMQVKCASVVRWWVGRLMGWWRTDVNMFDGAHSTLS